MPDITAALVKTLREMTSLGMMECKTALVEVQGDLDKAVEVLRKRGAIKSAQRADREAAEGTVQSYVHTNGKLGVLVEVRCETDFVAKSDAFQQFCRDLCMQIAAADPQVVDRSQLPPETVEKEKAIYAEHVKGKPANIADRILEGKLKDFYQRVCLVDQKFIKDEKKTISDLVADQIHKMGENIQIKRFVRFQVGA
jgi:elongation factor Ts